MKRILYLTLTIMLCLTFFTVVTWACLLYTSGTAALVYDRAAGQRMHL